MELTLELMLIVMIEVGEKSRSLHSTTHLCDRYAAAVSMPDEVYLLGGYSHEKEGEFLPKGSTS